MHTYINVDPDTFSIFSSTPAGNMDESFIESEYVLSTQGEWQMPCKECNEFFTPTFLENILPEDDHIMVHPACGAFFNQEEWNEMRNRGKYTHNNANHKIKGFHVNQFASMYATVQDTLDMYQPASPQEFYTQQLAQAFVPVEVDPYNDTDIMGLKGNPPSETLLSRYITVDVQTSTTRGRLEYSIIEFFGSSKEDAIMFTKEHQAIDASDNRWDMAFTKLKGIYERERPDRMLIDSGGWNRKTNEAGGEFTKQLVKKHFEKDVLLDKVRTIKGTIGGQYRKFIEYQDMITGSNRNYGDGKNSFDSLAFNTFKGKFIIHKLIGDSIAEKKSGKRQHFIINNDPNAVLGIKYESHLTSEKLVQDKNKQEWRQIGRRPVEGLDCLNYAHIDFFNYMPLNYQRDATRPRISRDKVNQYKETGRL